MKSSPCAYCDPYEEDSRHIFERIEKYIQFSEDILLSFVFLFERLFPWYQRWVLGGLYAFFSFIRVIRELPIQDGSIIGSRARTVFQETHTFGVHMKQIFIFGRRTNFFSLQKKKQKFIVEAGLPLVDAFSLRYRLHQADDKYALKKMLTRHVLPHAEGRAFFSQKRAFQYGMRLGFPLVVKPRTGSLSMHVTCDIRSEDMLKEALYAAFFIGISCIVERHISGDVYRLTLVRGKMVACCKREAPNVLGDGIHTIQELINEKNKDPRRGGKCDKTKTLHRICITPASEALLKKNHTSLDSVPAFHEKIYLHPKVILAAGADIHDVTDDVHPGMQDICEQAAKILKVPLLGFDLICQDIRLDPKEQPCAILEANTTPFFDMHHYPVTGKPRNVARILLEAQFS